MSPYHKKTGKYRGKTQINQIKSTNKAHGRNWALIPTVKHHAFSQTLHNLSYKAFCHLTAVLT
ncbi:MAG: hypothetical protein JWQ28_1515 [Pedobacter sp.]|jgi:hypothetical protein|nr:hypothetical protein [Pedobacter sp.]